MVGIAVLGCGTVGSGVMNMIAANADAIADAMGEAICLRYALDIRPVDVPQGAKWTSRFEDLLEDGGVDIAVETIGGVGVAYKFTQALLERGISVVTSNKELVVTHGAQLMEVARNSGARYLYEAAVAGGVPIIRPLRNDLAGNHISRICGIINGSTNYLLTRMAESGIDFQTALGEAKALGYVEANPAADIEGWDACRKLAILANTAFGAQLSDWERIPTEGIDRITEHDMRCAEALGGAIRLIAHGECVNGGWTGWVSPALLGQEHPLCHVSGVLNGILVLGDAVDEVLFSGRGAGSMPTASAVVADIIEIARGMKPERPMRRAVPHFVEQDDQPARLMVCIDSADAQAIQVAVDSHIPGSTLTQVQDVTALTTPVQPLAVLKAGIAGIADAGFAVGVPIRVL